MIVVIGVAISGILTFGIGLLVGLTLLLRHYFGPIGTAIGTAALLIFAGFLAHWTRTSLRDSQKEGAPDAEFLSKVFAWFIGAPALLCLAAALLMLRLVFLK
ncbi:hypothetical protein EON83_02270 [bacterium]|nr:MAG: hypothetical protein EON83_02270 [bacterium]